MSAGALVFWLKARLRLRGIHDWDSQMFLAQKITGSSFLRLDKEDFKELGLPLGVQIALRSLVEDIETSEQKRSLEDREREKKKRMHVEFKTFGSGGYQQYS